MIERKGIGRTPREHFMRDAENELEKFVRKELAFQQTERIERARKLRLPGLAADRALDLDQARN
jgi:hypothetical protein